MELTTNFIPICQVQNVYLNAMKWKLFYLILVGLAVGSCDVLKQTAGDIANEAITQIPTGGQTKPQLTSGEAAGGLKEALIKGVVNGTDRLGQVGAFANNPSLKILLPPEVQKIESKIRDNVILNRVVGPELDKAVEAMNKGAENSMKLATPVFKKAITNMTFSDAMNILTGGDGAATQYLKSSTETELQGLFKPEVKKALDEVKLNDIWNPVVTKINKNKAILGLDTDIQTDLNQYVTEKATSALFTEIEQEENQIRKDPIQRSSELLKKVFDYADKH